MEAAEAKPAPPPVAAILSLSPGQGWPCLITSKTGAWTRNDRPMLRAIEKESLDVVKAYFEGGTAIHREAFRLAAQAHRLEILQWLYALLADAGAAVPEKPDLFARVSLRFDVWFLRRAVDPDQLSLLQNHRKLALELKQAAGELPTAQPLCLWIDHHVLVPLDLWAA
jgi:hypothetical protein